MAWMQKYQPEHLLILASLLIGLKMGWPGSFHPFFYTLRWSAKDADNLLAAGCSIPCFGMAGSRLVEVWKCEEGKVLHKGCYQQQLKAQQDR